jgi:hypothetical protein
MSAARLALTRVQILGYRRAVASLDERLPFSATSLRRAAWAGLQDSMPRAALLSLHARVRNIAPTILDHPSLTQVWGPRFSVFVVAERDAAIFTLGRLPEQARGRELAISLATRLHATLGGKRLGHDEAIRPLDLSHPNQIRYATTSGRLRIRWEGARAPKLWTVPAPKIDASVARLELARRYLHVFGPATPASFVNWAYLDPASGRRTFDALARSLIPVRTPIGDAWILASDEAQMRARSRPSTVTRLLPSGDTYFLLQGADRALLVPDARRRSSLWTSRVWPGCILIDGDVAGTWRRAGVLLTIEPWRRMSKKERDAVEAEAHSLPLPDGRARLRWHG